MLFIVYLVHNMLLYNRVRSFGADNLSQGENKMRKANEKELTGYQAIVKKIRKQKGFVTKTRTGSFKEGEREESRLDALQDGMVALLEKGEELSKTNISRYAEMSHKRIKRDIAQRMRYKASSTAVDSETSEIIDILENFPDSQKGNKKMMALAHGAIIKRLKNKRLRSIYILKFKLGYSDQRTGECLGLSRMQIHREKKVLMEILKTPELRELYNELKGLIGLEGIESPNKKHYPEKMADKALKEIARNLNDRERLLFEEVYLNDSEDIEDLNEKYVNKINRLNAKIAFKFPHLVAGLRKAVFNSPERYRKARVRYKDSFNRRRLADMASDVKRLENPGRFFDKDNKRYLRAVPPVERMPRAPFVGNPESLFYQTEKPVLIDWSTKGYQLPMTVFTVPLSPWQVNQRKINRMFSGAWIEIDGRAIRWNRDNYTLRPSGVIE